MTVKPKSDATKMGTDKNDNRFPGRITRTNSAKHPDTSVQQRTRMGTKVMFKFQKFNFADHRILML
jgi:hypothetical protein